MSNKIFAVIFLCGALAVSGGRHLTAQQTPPPAKTETAKSEVVALANGGFEQDLENWQTRTGPGDGQVYQVTTTAAFAGRKALQVQISPELQGRLKETAAVSREDLPTQAGYYRVRFAMKTALQKGSAGVYLVALGDGKDDKKVVARAVPGKEGVPEMDGQSAWREYSFVYQLPIAVRATVLMAQVRSGVGSASFDEFRLEKMDETEGERLRAQQAGSTPDSAPADRVASASNPLIDGAKVSPAAFAAAIKRVDALVPSLPLTPAAAKWTRAARISQWTYANSATYREISTPEVATTRAKELKAQGFSVVLLSGAHFRSAHHTPARWKEIMRNARLAVEACHREGLRVVDHNDYTVVASEGYDEVFAHPEWLQTDIRFGRPERWFCPNDEGFTQHIIARLQQFQKETGVDGYMIDEVNFTPGACGCSDCRARFQKDTGFVLPGFSGSPVLFNADEPLWRLWRRWQQMSTVRFYAKVAQALRAIDPDNVQLSYSTTFIHPVVVESASDMWQRAGVVQFPGFEGTNVVFPGTRFLAAELNLRRAVAADWDKFSWSQFPASSPEELEYSSYLAALTGQAPFFPSNSQATFLTWKHWKEITHPRRAVADVGIVTSLATRDTGDVAALVHHEAYTGWSEALVDWGISHEPILDRSQKNGDLQRFRVIIAPACESLPVEFSQRLQQFAAAGGTLIVTGMTGVRDGNGFPLAEYSRPALPNAVNLQSIAPQNSLSYVKGEIIGGQDAVIAPTATGQNELDLNGQITLRDGIAYTATYKPNATVLATFADGKPAATETIVGRGRIVHLAFLPGHAAYEPRSRLGLKQENWLDPAARQIMRGLMKREEKRLALTRIAGAGVIGSIFRDDNATNAVVHLLNVGGIRQKKPGEEISRQDTIPTYPPTGEITIALPVWKIARAQWLAPDASGEVTLKIERTNSGATLRVPAGALQNYAAIRLTLAG
jgi:hypothetical protein